MFAEHDGEGDDGEDPRNGRVHLVGSAVMSQQLGYIRPKAKGTEAYRAISIAPADQGLVKRSDGLGAAGVPGWSEEGFALSFRRVGER